MAAPPGWDQRVLAEDPGVRSHVACSPKPGRGHPTGVDGSLFHRPKDEDRLCALDLTGELGL
jgi:hypothetical protein